MEKFQRDWRCVIYKIHHNTDSVTDDTMFCDITKSSTIPLRFNTIQAPHAQYIE